MKTITLIAWNRGDSNTREERANVAVHDEEFLFVYRHGCCNTPCMSSVYGLNDGRVKVPGPVDIEMSGWECSSCEYLAVDRDDYEKAVLAAIVKTSKSTPAFKRIYKRLLGALKKT